MENIISKKTLIIIIGVLLFLLLLLQSQNNKYKNSILIYENNISAMADSIQIIKNKVGELEYSKQMLIVTNQELGDYSKTLKEELEKEKKQVVYLSNIITTFSSTRDTVYIHDTLKYYGGGVYSIKWDLDTVFDAFNSRYISGESFIKYDSINNDFSSIGTKLYKDLINVKLTTGLIDDGGKIKIFVRSNYPGFHVNEIEGALIDPNKSKVLRKVMNNKKWHVGPGVYIGLTGNGQISTMIGVGITYSLFSF